jgi:voltage-gated potassium channel
MGEGFHWRRFVYAQAAFLSILAIGTVGFRAILDEGWVASFYRAVVTTTLTGLDTQPTGAGAQLFTIVLLLAGVAIFLYLAGAIVDLIAHGAISDAYAERKLRRTIDDLQQHAIICGFGRVGRRVAAEFQATGMPFVVLDHNADALEAAREISALVIEGDGTDDDDLRQAGIERAGALVASADSDESNLFITLSARAMRPDLTIVARASVDTTATKLVQAGADRVVQPYTAAGRMMANLVLKPQVTAFIDAVTTAAGEELRFEEIEVSAACGRAGETIRGLRIRELTGAMIVGIRDSDGRFDVTPSPDEKLDVGDVIIAAGTNEELQALEEMFAPREAVAG